MKKTIKRNKWGQALIMVTCPSCGGIREVERRTPKRSNFTGLCKKCYNKKMGKTWKGIPKPRGVNSPKWRGGRYKDPNGYIFVWVSIDDSFYPMADCRGYVYEHRLIMAKHLGRCLKSYEVIHHINDNKEDNRIENLQLLQSQTEHLPSTSLTRYIKKLEKENVELKKRLFGE